MAWGRRPAIAGLRWDDREFSLESLEVFRYNKQG